jgi:hypothetical protein
MLVLGKTDIAESIAGPDASHVEAVALFVDPWVDVVCDTGPACDPRPGARPHERPERSDKTARGPLDMN